MKFIHKLRLIFSFRNLLPFFYIFFVYGLATVAGFLLQFDMAYLLTTPLYTISVQVIGDILLYALLFTVVVFYIIMFFCAIFDKRVE